MNKAPQEDPLRPHIYDGIQEYDKRLPNWWLWTLWGSVVFAICYWAWFHAYSFGTDPADALATTMADNSAQAARAAVGSGALDDAALWSFSHDTAMLAAGKATFDTLCASCHKPDMTGLIGPNLLDNQWIHGGQPMEIVKTITEGVLAKGMVAWGPILGRQKIIEVTAHILAHHHPGEDIVKVDGWVPPGMPVPASTAPPAPAPVP